MGNATSLKTGDACSYCGKSYAPDMSIQTLDKELGKFADILLDVSKSRNADNVDDDAFSQGWHRCVDTGCSKICCPACYSAQLKGLRLFHEPTVQGMQRA